jgi:hypothetical protein
MAAMVVEKRSVATNYLARVFFPQIRILIPNSHVGVAECRFVTFHTCHLSPIPTPLPSHYLPLLGTSPLPLPQPLPSTIVGSSNYLPQYGSQPTPAGLVDQFIW